MAAHPQARPARVVEQHRSGYIVADGPGEGFAVESLPEWQRPSGYRKGSSSQDQRAAVGDWVLLDGKRIVALLPRRTAIKRGAAGEHYKQQVIAANIDTVLVVSGLDGDFNPRRIERYLLLVHGGGAQPVVVLTKADRDDSDVQAAIDALVGVAGQDVPVFAVSAKDRDSGAVPDPWLRACVGRRVGRGRRGGAGWGVGVAKVGRGDGDVRVAMEARVGGAGQGVAVCAVNAKDRDSVAVLDPWLRAGMTGVLVGSSGAGKSTLTNTLLGVEKMKTAGVRESDARGRHTTTHRALIPLPSGACLIDTPGMRELKPTGEEDLAEGGFADIEALAEQCKFRDCRHDREPGCAVRAAIEAGTLDPQRLANYFKLRDEVAGAADKLATRLAQKAGDKVQGKALHKRLDDKYGKR